MMAEMQRDPYRAVLEDLAKSRGLSGAEELASLAAEADPAYTAEDILTAAWGGFGHALDEALGGTTDQERARIVAGMMDLHGWR